MILGSGTGLWNGDYYDSIVPDQWKEDDCNGKKVCLFEGGTFLGNRVSRGIVSPGHCVPQGILSTGAYPPLGQSVTGAKSLEA